VAFLRIIQGARPGELHELVGDRIVLGRHPNCEVVLDNAAISRQHARMIREEASFVIEDLGSRNGTFVNAHSVSGLQPVANRDRIRICDIVLEFLEEMPLIEATVAEGLAYSDNSSWIEHQNMATVDADNPPEIESSSSIISTLNTGSIHSRLDVRPEVKLRAILEMSRLFSRTMDMPALMSKTLECLQELFPQSELGLVIFPDRQTGAPIIKAALTRDGDTSTEQKISSTVFQRAIETNAAILSEDLGDDTRFRESESASMLEIRSIMCSPLTGGEQTTFGAIQLMSKDLKKPFNQDDLDLFVSVTAQAGLAIENANMHVEIIQRREMERDLEVATQIQLGFLPNKKPTVLGFEFCHYYQAAQQVGGDYFDYVRLPDGRLVVVIGDVSGKGVPAALLMARLCSAVRYHLVSHNSVGRALTELNRELLDSSLGFRFITLIVVVIEPGSHELTIANAGHFPPLIYRPEGSEFLEVDFAGLPLGVGGEFEYHHGTIELAKGSTLLLYTDGIIETENHQKDLYGRERLREVRPEGDFSAEELINQILEDTTEFSEGLPQRDDRCVVAVKYVG